MHNAGIAQLVEHDLAKVGVAGSSPVSRSTVRRHRFFDASFVFSGGYVSSTQIFSLKKQNGHFVAY